MKTQILAPANIPAELDEQDYVQRFGESPELGYFWPAVIERIQAEVARLGISIASGIAFLAPDTLGEEILTVSAGARLECALRLLRAKSLSPDRLLSFEEILDEARFLMAETDRILLDVLVNDSEVRLWVGSELCSRLARAANQVDKALITTFPDFCKWEKEVNLLRFL